MTDELRLAGDRMMGWHVLHHDYRLWNGDNRRVTIGTTISALEVLHDPDRPIKVCRHGMHACHNILGCLQYSSSYIYCRVLVEGDIETKDDKFAGRQRTVLKWTSYIDGQDAIEEFKTYILSEAALFREKFPQKAYTIIDSQMRVSRASTNLFWIWKLCKDISWRGGESPKESASCEESQEVMRKYSRKLSSFVIQRLSEKDAKYGTSFRS